MLLLPCFRRVAFGISRLYCLLLPGTKALMVWGDDEWSWETTPTLDPGVERVERKANWNWMPPAFSPEVSITLPEGWRWNGKTLPRGIVDSEAFTHTIKVGMKENKLLFSRTERMGITFFPREKYEALKTVFDEMQDQDQEPVGFVRIEEPGEEEAANDEAASDEEPAAGNPSEDAAKPAEADEQQPAENAEEVTPVI